MNNTSGRIKRLLFDQSQYRVTLAVLILVALSIYFILRHLVSDTINQGILSDLLASFLGLALIRILFDFVGGDPLEIEVENLRREIKSLQITLPSYFSELIFHESSNDSNESGVIGVTHTFPDTNFAKLLSVSQKRVNILQTWMGNFIALENAIESAMRNNVKIQILLLNPDSFHAEARSIDIKYMSKDEVKHEIRSNLVKLERIYNNNSEFKSNLEVRLYEATPIMTLYWCDDLCYLGLFWRNKSAIQGPQLKISTNDKLFYGKLVQDHFNDIWHKSKIVELNSINAK